MIRHRRPKGWSQARFSTMKAALDIADELEAAHAYAHMLHVYATYDRYMDAYRYSVKLIPRGMGAYTQPRRAPGRTGDQNAKPVRCVRVPEYTIYVAPHIPDALVQDGVEWDPASPTAPFASALRGVWGMPRPHGHTIGELNNAKVSYDFSGVASDLRHIATMGYVSATVHGGTTLATTLGHVNAAGSEHGEVSPVFVVASTVPGQHQHISTCVLDRGQGAGCGYWTYGSAYVHYDVRSARTDGAFPSEVVWTDEWGGVYVDGYRINLGT